MSEDRQWTGRTDGTGWMHKALIGLMKVCPIAVIYFLMALVVPFYTHSLDSCHYPEFTIKSAELVSKGECQFGVGVCTTGEGVVMTANKIKGIRAGLAYNKDVARLMREHNDANYIVFGAKFTSLEEAIERLDEFFNAKFLEGRHSIRVQMIKDLEK